MNLVLAFALIVTAGCQTAGLGSNPFGGDDSQISLSPVPTLRPVSSSVDSRASRPCNQSEAITNGVMTRKSLLSPSSAASKRSTASNRSNRSIASRGSTKFTSPLTDRLVESRRSSNASADSSSLASTKRRDVNERSAAPTSRLVAYQKDDSTQESAEKTANEDALPFEDDESSQDNESLEGDGESSSSLDVSRSRSPSSSVAAFNANALDLLDVISSVTRCYPEIEIAIGEIEEARGEVLASWGEFDSVFSAHSISQPLGFYQTYRNGAGISRPLYGGGEVYGTYRIGDGNFEPWYGERETNEGGELKAGFSLPLLKDRAIDKRRAGVRAAELNRDQVEANIEVRLLQFERFATQAYWDWVASGQAVLIQRRLLKLAEQRVEQISARIEQGDLARISEIDNDRFIAKRKNGLIKARRGVEKAAIKLSMFLRDENCCPIVIDDQRLPTDFPFSQRIADLRIENDICQTLRTRPELLELAAARDEAFVKLQLAQNLMLPKLDLKGFAGQDLGGETSSKGDKTPFELQLGLFADVPLQRREAAGKIRAAQAKIAQIDAKRQFVSDKIRAEVQDAASAVNAAYDQIIQSRENVELNEQSLELGRLAFEEGDIDLLALNIYESSVADARLQLLEAQYKYFYSLAIYRTITSSEAFVNAPLSVLPPMAVDQQ